MSGDIEFFLPETETREEHYTTLVGNSVTNINSSTIQRRRLKVAFFVSIIVAFLGIVVCSVAVPVLLMFKDSVTTSDVIVALGSSGSLIGSMIILPKIIADHLFPKEGEKHEEILLQFIQQLKRNEPDSKLPELGKDSIQNIVYTTLQEVFEDDDDETEDAEDTEETE